MYTNDEVTDGKQNASFCRKPIKTTGINKQNIHVGNHTYVCSWGVNIWEIESDFTIKLGWRLISNCKEITDFYNKVT